jgi:tRNA A-37 threonylcarbamoyl transferase component Bud32
MIGQRWDELSQRLLEALESPDPAARVAASGDPDLVELLAWHRHSGGFLEGGHRAQQENPWLGRPVGGRYHLKSVLGRGGSGVVYEACDERVAGRRVVVKLLHDFWSSEDWMRRRFREEVAVLTRLDHPGIVSLIDAGEIEDGRLFLVLPFHEARTLRDALAGGPLDATFAARLLREIGEAVGYAHSHGVVHRDLKPENILLVRRSDGEHPLLIDFGIARVGDPGGPRATTTHLMGSAFYMAPEHLMGKAQAASDVYSLGVIAWEMLTGARPFDSASPFALPELQRKGVGDAFFRLRTDLGTAVGRQLARALAFDPARRPALVAAFTGELADSLQAGALDSRLARLWVMRRSRRWVLASGATALAGAAAGGWWLRDWLSPLGPEERAIDFRAGDDAAMAGFSIHRELTERAVRDFPGGSVSAMRYTSPDLGLLYKRLTLRQKERAFRRGWRLSALCRPESGSACVAVATGKFAHRFDAGFKATQDRVELIATKQIRTGWDGIHAAVRLPPPPRLVQLEIAYDPARASATVSVEGETLIRDYTGHTEYRDDLGVLFGIGSIDGSMASAVLGGLHFEILE